MESNGRSGASSSSAAVSVTVTPLTTNTHSNPRPYRKLLSLPLLPTLGPQVLEKAIANYKTPGGLTRDDFVGLHWAFGSMIQAAFEIIDSNNKSTLRTSTSTAAATPTVPAPSNPSIKSIVIYQCSTKSSPSIRVMVRVRGSKDAVYWIKMTHDDDDTSVASPVTTNRSYNLKLPSSGTDCTCQCVYYQWKKDFCKHILAAYFYLGVTDEYVEMDEEEFNSICAQIRTVKS